MMRENSSSDHAGSHASSTFTVFSACCASSGKYFGKMLLCLLVVQNTSAVLLARYTRTKYNYNVNHMLLVSEIMKFFTSFILEAITYNKTEDGDEEKMPITEGGDNNRKKRCIVSQKFSALFESLRIHIWENPRDALKLTVPSGLYLLQNSLVYYSISLVPVPLFQITQQTKLVTTAFLSVLVLKRKYDGTQWFSILALCVGAAICILSHHTDSSKESTGEVDGNAAKHLFGLMLVILSNLSSSIAGVYFEVVIKGKESSSQKKAIPSIWMRNIQLAFFTICIICVKLLSEDKQDFFYDFTPLLWLQISIFAFGGLLVASVIKYTDSVQKGLAAGLSVITSSALSLVIEGGDMSINFVLGSILAIGGCFFFANPNLDLGQIPCPSNKSASVKKMLCTMIVIVPMFSMMYDYKQIRPNFMEYVEPKASEVPDDWKDHLHVHIYQAVGPNNHHCGGCMVLWELFYAVQDLGISTSQSHLCPDGQWLEETAGGKTIVIVMPENIEEQCTVPSGNAVKVHWILAPLGRAKPFYKGWGEEDLVFNYASSTAVHPELLPSSNILQVITNPKEGDEYDLPPSIFQKPDREGTAYMMRKAHKWHSQMELIHEQLPEPRDNQVHVTPEDLMQYEYFVSYDPYTFYSYAAAMSGVVSIVYPIEGVSKKEWELGTYVGEYLKENGGDVPGIAYGMSDEEIKYARETMPQLRDFMMKVRRWGREKTVERFARDCYRYGMGEREFEAGLLVRDAYTNWYDANDQLISLE